MRFFTELISGVTKSSLAKALGVFCLGSWAHGGNGNLIRLDTGRNEFDSRWVHQVNI